MPWWPELSRAIHSNPIRRLRHTGAAQSFVEKSPESKTHEKSGWGSSSTDVAAVPGERYMEVRQVQASVTVTTVGLPA